MLFSKGRYEKSPEDFQRDYDREYIATMQRKACQITAVAPRPNPRTGFYNFPSFTVKGKKATTNRINTRSLRARDAETAGKQAVVLYGLIEPLEIVEEPFCPATGINDYGIRIPRGACQDDELALIWSVQAHDDMPVTAGFYEFATMCDIPVSWLQGRNKTAQDVIDRLSSKGRAVLYGYAVDCALHGWPIGNPQSSPRVSLYDTFSKAAVLDEKAYASICSRPGSDIWRPNKNTASYKFAEPFFRGR